MCVILCTCAYLVLECHKVNIVMCYKRQGVALTLSKHCPVKLTKEMTRLLPTVYSPPTPLMTLSAAGCDVPTRVVTQSQWRSNQLRKHQVASSALIVVIDIP